MLCYVIPTGRCSEWHGMGSQQAAGYQVPHPVLFDLIVVGAEVLL